MALTVLGAALALAVGAGAGEQDRALAAAKPRLVMTSFSADRTIRPGRTSTVSVSCRRGFALLGSRFQPISVNPANATPVFETLAIVPQPKGAGFTFRNTGTATIQIRVIADCTRISGRPSLRTYVASRAFRLRPRASAAGAQASARKRLGVVCARRNSIPADIGFEARRNDLVRMGWFRTRRGRIGVRGVFSGNRPEKVKLHLSCVQGRGVRLAGRLSKRTGRAGRNAGQASSEATASRRRGLARRPTVILQFGQVAVGPHPNLPFDGMLLTADPKPRAPWGSPMPASMPEGASLGGRGWDEPARPKAPPGPSGAELRRILTLITPEEEPEEASSEDAVPLPSFSGALVMMESELRRVLGVSLRDLRKSNRTGGTGGSGGTETEEPGGGTDRPSDKTVKFTDLTELDCTGFYLDIFLPPDAQEPITHEIIGPEPCPSATYTVDKFPAGEKPPGTRDGDLRWKYSMTYRINVVGADGTPSDATIKVSWKNP